MPPSALIVDTSRVMPVSLEAVEGGIVAKLAGPGLMRVLDAAMIGDGAIQLWIEGADLRPLLVTEIAMQGGLTLVIFTDAAKSISVN